MLTRFVPSLQRPGQHAEISRDRPVETGAAGGDIQPRIRQKPHIDAFGHVPFVNRGDGLREKGHSRQPRHGRPNCVEPGGSNLTQRQTGVVQAPHQRQRARCESGCVRPWAGKHPHESPHLLVRSLHPADVGRFAKDMS